MKISYSSSHSARNACLPKPAGSKHVVQSRLDAIAGFMPEDQTRPLSFKERMRIGQAVIDFYA